MKKVRVIIVALLLATAGTVFVISQLARPESITEAQIRANVPEDENFDRFFKRDLEAYFQETGKAVAVEYEL